MQFWKVLKVSDATNEEDFKAMCANKIKGPYVVLGDKYRHAVAVLLDKDIDVVLSAFDVVDRKLETSLYQGSTLIMAADAWHDYLKSGRR